MSGDNAPAELIRGAAAAAESFHAELTLIGDRSVILESAAEMDLDLDAVSICHAPGVIDMEDAPLCVVREKADSSMAVGLKMLANDEGDAFVSCGNTGALIAGATLIVRRIKGIQRAGIATILPLSNPVLLMDSGANLEVNSANLEQFAFMGSKYMERVLSVKNPRVGLLNNGTESCKGLPLQRDAYEQLKDSEVNFVGNVEARDVPLGGCDVLVTDGFTGNIVLKLTEGMGKFMMGVLKDLFYATPVTKLSALPLRGRLKNMKRRFDASEYGGAPLLGISRPVIKAHGSSDARAFSQAIGQAIGFADSGLNREIARYAIGYEERMKERMGMRAAAEKARAKRKEQREDDATADTDTE